MDSARYRIGVDIGGTCTDVVLLDTHTQQLRFTKVFTTPADPAVGFFAGVEKTLARGGGDPAQVQGIFHGSTVAPNAVVEGKGRRMGLLVTQGFHEMLEIGRAYIPGIFTNYMRWEKPARLVSLELVRERQRTQPWGLYGRCPAANDAYVERANGTIVMLPATFDHFPIAPGDMVVMRTGGGGWGHPYKRDPEQVRRDVACGLLTIVQARDLYGVALTGWPPRVDVAATQRLRADAPARNDWIDRGEPQATPGPNTYWELEEPPVPWLVSGRLG